MRAINERNFTDQDLVNSVLRGNTHAFGLIIKHTEGLVAQIVCKMINRLDDRKDIVQDIYLKTFKNLPGFKFHAKLSTWIGQIAYNTCINFLEKKKLVLVDDLCDDNGAVEYAMEMVAGTNGPGDTTETLISNKELSSILAAETEKLSPVYKTLITLYHNEDLSYADIAQITGLPAGTVKNYLFRARKTLKENLLARYKKEEL